MRACSRLCVFRASCGSQPSKKTNLPTKQLPRNCCCSRMTPSCMFRFAGRTIEVNVMRACSRLCHSVRFAFLLRLLTCVCVCVCVCLCVCVCVWVGGWVDGWVGGWVCVRVSVIRKLKTELEGHLHGDPAAFQAVIQNPPSTVFDGISCQYCVSSYTWCVLEPNL